MPRPSRDRRHVGRRSVSYLITIGAVSTIGALPLLSAAPALAQNVVTVDVTVEAGQVAHITLPGSGSYLVYSWPNCGKASWAGTAYTFDTTDTTNGRPACDPGTTSNSLLDSGSGDRINVNLTVTPATAPEVLAVPSAPAAPSVSNSGMGQLTISWAAADPAEQVDGYEYSLDNGLSWTAGTSPTVVSNLPMGVYPVGVRAHNASGYGAPSTFVPTLVFVMIIPPVPTPPIPPTPTPTPPPTPTPTPTPTVTPPAAPGRPVVTPGNRSIGISWSVVPGASSYEYSVNAGNSWSSPTTRRFATVNGLQNGHAYTVRVRALSGTVAGAASVAVSATPKQPVEPTPAPALPPTPAMPTTRQQGSRGSDVVRIQRLLGIPADGVFGPQTAGAVRSFQAAHHLQVDGIVGRQTWTALLAGGSGAATGSVVAAATRPWLQVGSTGSYVRTAQQLLGVTVDGVFGAQTRAAVVAFQGRHHLQVDGIVGAQTWAALLAR